MPPAGAPPLVTLHLEHVGKTLELLVRRNKGREQHVVYLKQGAHREAPVWLPADKDAVQHILDKLPDDVRAEDITDEFRAACTGGDRTSLAASSSTAPDIGVDIGLVERDFVWQRGSAADADIAAAEAEMFGPHFESQSPARRSRDASKRARRQHVPYSPSKGWSEYDKSRLDERHDRVRAESYADVLARAERLEAKQKQSAEELERLRAALGEMDSRVDGCIDGTANGDRDAQRLAAEALQQAAIDLLDGEETDVRLHVHATREGVSFNWNLRVSLGDEDDAEDDGDEAAASSASGATPSHADIPPDGRAGKKQKKARGDSSADGTSAPSAARSSAHAAEMDGLPAEVASRRVEAPTAVVRRVTSHVNGRPILGLLALYADKLAWGEPCLSESTVVMHLGELKHAKLKSSFLTPFAPPQQSIVVTRRDGTVLTFYGAHSRTAVDELQAFHTTLSSAIAEAPHIDDGASQAAREPHSQDVTVRLTARVQAGRALRAKLQAIARLRNNEHQIRQADADLAELAASSAVESAGDKRKLDSLAKQRVLELRREAFSYGDYAVTKEVLRRFVTTPEVREILPLALQTELSAREDADVKETLLATAKHMIGTVYKAAGKRTDINRNALESSLATLVPHNIFENRHGRAACRILGLHYRQAKRGSQRNKQLTDLGRGWRQLSDSEHRDKVRYAEMGHFWKSELASTPDNQNKEMIRVDAGVDQQTGERLYVFHARRAQLANDKELLPLFRRSSFGAAFRERSKTKKRPNGVCGGMRQFALSKCACIKKRKARECDCPECTFIDRNLALVHAARPGWHRKERNRIGSQPHECHIHVRSGAVEGMAEYADALASSEEAWRAAAESGDATAVEQWELAEQVAAAARLEAAAIVKKAERAKVYDRMTSSRSALTAALHPCGKRSHLNFNVTGEDSFRCFKRQCIEGNCEKKLGRPREACGLQSVFGDICPLERSGDRFSWFTWEKALRGVSKEGNPFYSLDWQPKHGTRQQFWESFLAPLQRNMLHDWRDHMMSQARRVLADRRSGRQLESLLERRCSAEAMLSADELAASSKTEAVAVLAEWAAANDQPNPVLLRCLSCAARREPTLRLAITVFAEWAAANDQPYRVLLRCLSCAAHREAAVRIVSHLDASSAVASAARVYKALRTTAVKQADYAAQIETRREFTATCAIRERHNCEVTVVGFKPHVQTRPRTPRKRKPKRRMPYNPKLAEASAAAPISAAPATIAVRKQHVAVFFAYHKSGLKPSARTHNLAQEDIDHILKYGSALHGEWFCDGKRLPGGDHRVPLPDGGGLSECTESKPVFPEMRESIIFTDRCPNQYDYGTNYHQAAVWETKTAQWALVHTELKRTAAARRLATATEAFKAASAAEKDALAPALKEAKAEAAKVADATKAVIDSDGLADAIHRTDVLLIEHHGKGSCDAESNVPKFTIADAITKGLMLDPETRCLVRYMALHKPRPSVDKSLKDGWEAPESYYHGYFDTRLFTKKAVPDAEGFRACRSYNVFRGVSKDPDKAERDGPLHVRKMFHSCDACLLGKFDECTMESEIGKMLRQPKGSPAKHGALSRSQALRLQDFGDQIDKDWLLAVDVDPTQHIVEGIYWLARTTGPAFLIAEDTVHSGQQYRAGWLVVPARWYMLRQKSERGYELLSPIVWLVVNHCIRLKGLAASASNG